MNFTESGIPTRRARGDDDDDDTPRVKDDLLLDGASNSRQDILLLDGVLREKACCSVLRDPLVMSPRPVWVTLVYVHAARDSRAW